MLNSDANRALVIRVFPRLADDVDFVISGGSDPNYNCIAWAGCENKVWWWPLPLDKRPSKRFDGVINDWPFEAAEDTRLETLNHIFGRKGYEVCLDGTLEPGYRKVCFYGNASDEISHAARQLIGGDVNGKWTSKLGDKFRITHGSPDSLISPCPPGYGKVLGFMKVKFP